MPQTHHSFDEVRGQSRREATIGRPSPWATSAVKKGFPRAAVLIYVDGFVDVISEELTNSL